MNKGKPSIAVDMKSPRGKKLVTQVITALGEDAGMFLTNLRVRGWMDHQTLGKRREDMVMVTLQGDRKGRPAIDYTVNPALGFPEITGHVGSTDPVTHALPAWDCIAGNVVVSPLLAAERHRLRHGTGQDVEVSLKDVASAMLGHLGIIADPQPGGEARTKSSNALYWAYVQRVMVTGFTDRQWVGLVNVTETELPMVALANETGMDLRDEGVRWKLRDRITAILALWFAAHPVKAFAGTFDRSGVTWPVFRGFAGALKHDLDLSTNNPMFEDVLQSGLGTVMMPKSPFSFSDVETRAGQPAPALGMGAEEILGDVVGVCNTEIAQFFDKGIVQAPHIRRVGSWDEENFQGWAENP